MPFAGGNAWGRGRAIASDTASFCLVGVTDAGATQNSLSEIARQTEGRTGVVSLALSVGSVFWIDGERATLRMATTPSGAHATVVVDFEVCKTKSK